MDYRLADGMQISRMTLGTAQLGLDYGVANTVGKLDRAHAMEILEVAARNGINCFDTAPGYGDSESIVGSFISSYSDFSSPPVPISKLPPIDLTGRIAPGVLAGVVREHVVRTTEGLQVSRIPIYLLHRASDMKAHDGLIIESLAKLRDEGLIGVIGVSVYSAHEVEQALEIDAIRAIQVPVSVFDQRLIRSGLLNGLKSKNMIVFARSIFLQGLLLLELSNLPVHMVTAVKPLRRLHQICGDHGMSAAQVAVAFVRDLPGVTSLVVGAERPEQVRENVGLMESPSLAPEVTNEIMAAFSDLPLEVVDPRMWKSDGPERAGQSR